jgi:hypothetical protein
MSQDESQRYKDYIAEMKDYCNQEIDCAVCPFYLTEMCLALKSWQG